MGVLLIKDDQYGGPIGQGQPIWGGPICQG